MNSEKDFKNQWHELLIIYNLKLTAFAFPDESMALLLRPPIMVLLGVWEGPTFQKIREITE